MKKKMTREEIVNEVFCDSPEMRAHLLKAKNCDDRDLLLAVCGAPISLQRKLEILEAYRFKTKNKWHSKCIYRRCLTALREALAQLEAKDGDVFLWRNHWYDLDMRKIDQAVNQYGEFRPCRSIKDVFVDVQAVIAREIAYAQELPNAGEDCAEKVKNQFAGIQIEKFELKPDEEGRMRLAESPWLFVAIGEDICYVDYMSPTVPKSKISDAIKSGLWGFSSMAFLSLYLNIPFKKGDAVTIDCSPFMPRRHMVFTAVKNGSSGCAQVAFEDEDGSRVEMPFKHSYCHSSPFSGLYRLTLHERK